MLELLASKSSEPTVTVLFPYVGGQAYTLRPVAEELREGRAFGVDYPGHGRGANLPFARSIEDIATALAPEIIGEFESERLTLVGHSLGALVAFETARALEASSREVEALVVSSCTRPSDVPDDVRSLYQQADDVLIDLMVANGGLPPELAAEPLFLEFALPIIRADIRLYEAYYAEPGAGLRAAIRCVGGLDDPMLGEDGLAEWRPFTTSSFDVIMVAGGHFHILSEPTAVAAVIEPLIS